jgi:hypothetical protein
MTVCLTVTCSSFNIRQRGGHGPKTARSATEEEEESYYPHKSSIQATIHYQLRLVIGNAFYLETNKLAFPPYRSGTFSGMETSKAAVTVCLASQLEDGCLKRGTTWSSWLGIVRVGW